ncbi:hypothetical protein, partial [Streptomyces sp. NPDC086010]|uniref:hypothetical protein n=1 Tax=Streptomyces sp. NPDC086010 TaxID=3365745 RepID=UPI0037D8060C
QNEWLRSYFDTAIDSVVSAVEAFQSAGVTMQKELHVYLFRYNSKFYIFRNESAGIDVEQREDRRSEENTLATAHPFTDSIVIYPYMMEYLNSAVVEPEPHRNFPTNVRRPHFAVLLHELAHVVSVGHSGLERLASTFAPGVEGALALFGPYGRTNTQEALAEFMTALLLGADEPGGRFHTHAASVHREKAHELYRALGGAPVRQVLPAPALTAEELTWLTERVNTLTAATAVVDSTIVQQVYDTLPTWTKWQVLPTLADQVRKHLPGTPAEPWMLDHAAWEYYTERRGEMAGYVLRETLKLLGAEHPHLADTDRIKHAFRRIDETVTSPWPAAMAQALKDAVLSDQNPTDPHHTEEGAHLPAAEPFNQESFPSPIPPPATPAPLQPQPTQESVYGILSADSLRPSRLQKGLESASLARTRPSDPHRGRGNRTPRPLAEHAAWNAYASQPDTAAQADFVMRHALTLLKWSYEAFADPDLIKRAYGQLDDPLSYNSPALAEALANIVLTGRPSVALPGGAREEEPGVQEQTGPSAGPSHTTGTTTAPAQTPSPVPVLAVGVVGPTAFAPYPEAPRWDEAKLDASAVRDAWAAGGRADLAAWDAFAAGDGDLAEHVLAGVDWSLRGLGDVAVSRTAVKAAYGRLSEEQLRSLKNSRELTQALVTMVLNGSPDVPLLGGARRRTDEYLRAAEKFVSKWGSLEEITLGNTVPIEVAGGKSSTVGLGMWLHNISHLDNLPSTAVLSRLLEMGWAPDGEPVFNEYISTLREEIRGNPGAATADSAQRRVEVQRLFDEKRAERLREMAEARHSAGSVRTFAGDILRQALQGGASASDIAQVLNISDLAITHYLADGNIHNPSSSTAKAIFNNVTLSGAFRLGGSAVAGEGSSARAQGASLEDVLAAVRVFTGVRGVEVPGGVGADFASALVASADLRGPAGPLTEGEVRFELMRSAPEGRGFGPATDTALAQQAADQFGLSLSLLDVRADGLVEVGPFRAGQGSDGSLTPAILVRRDAGDGSDMRWWATRPSADALLSARGQQPVQQWERQVVTYLDDTGDSGQERIPYSERDVAVLVWAGREPDLSWIPAQELLEAVYAVAPGAFEPYVTVPAFGRVEIDVNALSWVLRQRQEATFEVPVTQEDRATVPPAPGSEEYEFFRRLSETWDGAPDVQEGFLPAVPDDGTRAAEQWPETIGAAEQWPETIGAAEQWPETIGAAERRVAERGLRLVIPADDGLMASLGEVLGALYIAP